MGLLEGLLSEVVGSLGGGKTTGSAAEQHSGLATNLLQMLASPKSGGIGGLLQGFDKAGLGHLMQGWISTGPNPEPTPAEVEKGLGKANLQALSAQTGMSIAALLPLVVKVLPVLIDKMTPQGKLPPAATATQQVQAGGDPLAALLSSLLGGR